MAEMVNLRRARKARARADKDKAAEASRAAHGVSKVTRKLSEARQEQMEHRLSSHRLEKDEDHN